MGIYVIRATSREDAQSVADSDPFHAQGFRNYELLDWEMHQVMGAGPFSSGEMAYRREMAGGESIGRLMVAACNHATLKWLAA